MKLINYFKTLLKILNKIIALPLILIIWIYKKIVSPFLPPACRFYPTCSEYSLQALKKYGFVKGVYLSGRRISRCHPGNEGGYDPLP